MNQFNSAATDVTAFMSDLDGGQFERQFSAAISQCAAGAVDHGKPGQVVVTFEFKKIEGTHQVHVNHKLKFTRPTEFGKAGEEATRVTTMHVGKYGKLAIAPENQLDIFAQPKAVA